MKSEDPQWRSKVHQHIPDIQEEEGITYKLQYLKEVVILNKGASFGELALTNDAPRSASIVCLDPHTDFAVLNKATYKRVMGKATQRKVELMIAFLRNFRIFQSLSEFSLQ